METSHVILVSYPVFCSLLLLTIVALFMRKFVVQPLLRNGYILC
jgi:hypothetical protein